MGIEVGAGTTEEAVRPGAYRYRLSDMRARLKHGTTCDVCGSRTDEPRHLTEEQAYDDDGRSAWTRYECIDLFGHEKCLLGARRTPRVGG